MLGSVPVIASAAPGAASSPNPPTGTIGVMTTPNLSWSGNGATSYDIRFGTANPPPTVVSNTTDRWYPPPSLTGGTTYFWQIVTKNSGGSTTGPMWSFTTAGSGGGGGGGGTLRMMTWNIQSGLDLNSNYVLPSQVQFIAAQNPDVVVLQEVSMWNEDQPTKFRTLMQQATGYTWYTVWAPAPTCLTTGCIGELIMTKIPITASSTTYLGPSSAGRAQITVAGLPINIVTNHLEAYDLNLRTIELNGLMSWERAFPGPRLMGGDFNSWWGEWWIGQIETEYTDTWVDVTGVQDGAYTIGNVRFDYIFRSMDGGYHLQPLNAWVASTTLSDHRPFIADFRVQ
jgi:endonuclease/exonuclease/phosphatase family metal-dependent hydrolase